jgi:hypothetical protein
LPTAEREAAMRVWLWRFIVLALSAWPLAATAADTGAALIDTPRPGEAGAAAIAGTAAWTTGADEAGRPVLAALVRFPDALDARIVLRRNRDNNPGISHVVDIDTLTGPELEGIDFTRINFMAVRRSLGGEDRFLQGATLPRNLNRFSFLLSADASARANNAALLADAGFIALGLGYITGGDATLVVELDDTGRAALGALLAPSPQLAAR